MVAFCVGSTAKESTASDIPVPKADQALPFQRATRLALTPPAVVKWPPAYTLLPDTTSPLTRSFIPEPSADQMLPFHRAT